MSILCRLICTGCIALCNVVSHAQDRYFTQFYTVPLDINPALTGAIDGSYRVSMIYHDQWRGILDNPYQTYGVFGDLRFEVGRTSKDYAGAGLSVVADRTGVFNFNTTQINLSAAFHKFLDAQSAQYLSGGLYLGIVQRSINYENLIFDDQFNGLDQYSFVTRENLPENNLAHADLGLGINYMLEASKKFGLSGGIAIGHIIAPSVSFFRRTEGQEDAEDITLKSKLTAYANTNIVLNESVSILPRFAFFSQGPVSMLQFGTHVRFAINNHNNNALHLGAGLRLAKELENLKPSSLMALTGIELGSFLLGLSYEYSLDDLANDRLGQGIFELSLTFIGEYENTSSFCPSF
ncbi:MAG TPA: PorP/SprF family type IX secretion system membrane protein [Saprospiraceae bacterium]|nr:PorP/SprF family type IX secretion system membrane protein [Saprospiraceae bacterium]